MDSVGVKRSKETMEHQRTYELLTRLQRAQTRWQEYIIEQIRSQEWDHIGFPEFPSGWMKSDQHRMERWLFCSLLSIDPFVPGSEEVLLRLFGEEIQEKGWLYYLVTMSPSPSAVEYFLQRDIGDLNRSYGGSTLLEHVLFQMSYTVEERLRLLRLLIEKGVDINIPHETSRETPLFRCVDYICDVWHSVFEIRDAVEIEHTEIRKREYAIIANTLLDYGAEPLLENEHGITALYWLESEGQGAVADDLLARMMTFA